MRTYRAKPGEWIEIIGRRHRLTCCDCGLVHDLQFRLVRRGGKVCIQFRAWRNERSTGQTRRWMRKEV